MEQLEKVEKGLQTAVDSDWMWRKADYIAMCCKDALALINAQQERIKALEAKQQWISVKDRLPPMYHMVLITGKDSAGGSFGVIKGSCDGDKRKWYRDDIGQYVDSSGDTVTHWMPFPEPPKEEEHESLERNRP